ncbi:MAG TPA: epimerase, partial [Vicinamibacteria bacterium]|nr:epimerase [Vicinamibacteria bacterium]
LALCAVPARPLVVTGPAPVSVREVAERFGARYGRPVRFAGEEGPLALLGDPAECMSRLGPPEVPLDRLIEWTAAWVEQGGRSLGKPTRFERTDGRF